MFERRFDISLMGEKPVQSNEPAVFASAVAKQHEVFLLRHADVTVFGALVSVRTSF